MSETKENITKVKRGVLHDEGRLLEDFCASETCAYRGKEVCTFKTSDYCPMFVRKGDSVQSGTGTTVPFYKKLPG